MLEVTQLVKRFGDKEVLHGLSFQADEGHIVGLIGKNGSGKTTLFHSILRFIRFEGDILLDGEVIRQSSYSRIGYLPEERSLMPKWTILEQVQYLAQLKGLSASQVKQDLPKWMERLAVKGRLTDKIKTLSKGNQQKIQLIITLIHRPDFIILDEPFSGLDPVNTALLKEVILAEKKRGALILFSDHVMTNVQEICDDLLMIRDGDLVLNGTVQEVRNHFGKTRIRISGQYTKEQLEALPHVRSAQLEKDGNWLLKIDDESAGEALFDDLTKGQYVETFVQEAPSLDEIFKHVAQGGKV